MRVFVILVCVALALLWVSGACLAYTDPPWIFGMHDNGAEYVATGEGKTLWIVMTEELGADPRDMTGPDYSGLTRAGHGIIARLNYGYSPDGTIPAPDRYRDFAKRCANFVRASKGDGHIWIIGNEMNLSVEWPNGKEITPDDYARCFLMCRKAIRQVPGHEKDWVIPGALSPQGKAAIDWFNAMMSKIGDDCDGFAVHCYTGSHDPKLIFSDQKSPEGCYVQFRAYRDYMKAIPGDMRDLPVFITETDAMWTDEDNGWVKNAFAEINDWNTIPGNQKIRAVCLYRWLPYDQWSISNRYRVIRDFREALQNDYRWTNK